MPAGVPISSLPTILGSALAAGDYLIVQLAAGGERRIAASELCMAVCPFIDARAFGVVGDGTTDDTEAVQAALDAGTVSGRSVVLPPGTFKITETLRYGSTSQQSHYSLIGAGSLASRLRWEGDQTGAGAVLMRPEKMFRGGIRNLGFTNPAGADGNNNWGETVGLWLANSTGGTGTGQTGNTFADLHFEGFAQGTVAGDVVNTRATSELIFDNCLFQYCGTGFQAYDSNTLDIELRLFQAAYCNVGLSVGQCGNLHVYGGSASYNRADFFFGTGGTFSVNGFRSEVCSENCVIVSGPGRAPCRVAIRNCNFQAIKTGGGDYGAGTGGTGGGCAVWLYGGAEVTIDQCHIEGWVGVADYYSRPKLTMVNTTVRPLPGQTGPFAFYWGTETDQYGDRYLDNLRYDIRGCSRMEQDSPFWPPVGPTEPEVFYPDPAAFFTDAAGVCPATTSRDVPAVWD